MLFFIEGKETNIKLSYSIETKLAIFLLFFLLLLLLLLIILIYIFFFQQ